MVLKPDVLVMCDSCADRPARVDLSNLRDRPYHGDVDYLCLGCLPRYIALVRGGISADMLAAFSEWTNGSI